MSIKKRIDSIRNDFHEYQEIKEERRIAKSKNKYQTCITQYANAYQKRVSDNTVLYESFWGRGLVDNPYAIFLELLGRQEFAHLKHIWVIDDLDENRPIMEYYRNRKNVVFVKFGSEEYLVALATAKYLVNNTTFQSFFVKKPEQIYINTWHGTPIKAMGYHVPGGNIEVANIVRNFLSTDYLLAANSHMTNMYLYDYKMQEIYPGEILLEGYPRNDLLVRKSSQDVKAKLKAFGIQIQENKKLILYAPTWRESSSGKAVVNPNELLEIKNKLETALDSETYQILIKPHQLVYKQLKDMEEYKGLLVPATIDANELMSVVDIMISDYSSIFLDYMVLGRPILFFIPDLEEYRKNRGLDFTPEELPGPVYSQLEDVIGGIQHIDEVQKQYKKTYQAMQKQMCPYEDGSASQRIVNIVFGKKKQYNSVRAEKTKETLLLHRGLLLENGISHSFLNLLQQIDYDRFDVTVYVINDASNPAVSEKINGLMPNVRVLVRTGPCVATVEEEAKREFVTRRGMYGKMNRKLYPVQVASREFRRCFGDTQYDYIVDFEGYNSMYSMVMLQGNARIKSIWMHSDIKADMDRTVNGKKTLFKALNFNVSLYPYFDRLVSCGKTVMEVNRKKLAVDSTRSNFVHARNTVDAKRIEDNLKIHENAQLDGKEYILQGAEESYENRIAAQLILVPDDNLVNFVTMGRLSTEKNHGGLIKAFAKLHEEYPQVRLYILGDGPLRGQEEQMVRSLGLRNKVLLPGNVRNPFAVMQKCQCFILPSFYEGQPMVLLEARAIHMPIIVSDFSTVVDSLLPEGQMLIETAEEKILEGMRSFMLGQVPAAYKFDIQEYNREAYQEFVQAIT